MKESASSLRGVWWWIDRWRRSNAWMDMTLAEQGAYRNLLDELWLRGGVLPNDERTLARACGDPLEWPNLRDKVLAKFTLTDKGWVNSTASEVIEESRRLQAVRRDAGRRGYSAVERGEAGKFTGKTGKRAGKGTASRTGNTDGQTTASPSPSPSPFTDQRTTDNGTAAPAADPDWNRDLADDFRGAYHGDPPGQLFAQVKPLVRKFGWSLVRGPLREYMAETPLEFLNIPKVLGVRIQAGPKPREPSPKARERLAGMEALIRGGMRDGRELDSGHGGTHGDVPGSGPRSAGNGREGPGVPAGVGAPVGQALAVRGARGDPK